MELFITSDANSESGVGEVVGEISGPTSRHFATEDYGGSLLGIAVVLMCRNPELNFRRRLRFARKEKTVYMDVMLDLEQMRSAEHERRKRIIVERVAKEIQEVLSKYSIRDFDDARFLEDIKGWLAEIGNARSRHKI